MEILNYLNVSPVNGRGFKMNKIRIKLPVGVTFTLRGINDAITEIEYEGKGMEITIIEDDFGRKWELIPVMNESIIMPFIITPIHEEKK